MSKWEVQTYKLDQLGTVSRGKSRHRPRNDQSLYGGKYPFIQTGDVKSANFYITKYSQTYNEKGLSQSKLWNKGTLCITIAANIAETAILGIDACFPDSIVGFIPFENKSDVRYIKYCFDIYQKEMQAMSLGATQDNFSVEKMLKVKFIVPPLQNQQKIADILSTYDDLIENNNRRIELLEKAAENLYKEWFVRFRFPNYKKTKFEKGLPHGWKIGKLGDVVNVTSSKRVYLSDYVEYGVPFYRSKEVIQLSNGKAISELLYISEEKYLEFKNKYGVPKQNDILLTSVGTIGIPLLVSDNKPFYFKDGNLTWIQSSLNAELAIYLYFWIKSDIGQQQLLSSTIGTSQSALTIERLKNIKIVVPTNDIISEFNNFTSDIMEKINNLQTQNQNLIKQRDLLLPRLMSGKLEV